jgi:peptide/nickel transport system permease protein
VFVRAIYGTRVSLLVGVLATLIAVVVGIVLGVVAGYFGGWIDTVISRVTDIILSVPLLLFAIGIVAACSTSKDGCLYGTLKPGLSLVVTIISLFTWPYVARLVRGNTLSLREREFVEAARSLGASDLRIMFHEILPNLVSPIIVYASLLVPSNILFEAYLSFLGLGVPDNTPSWGSMISESLQDFDVVWWLWLFPGLFLLLSVLAFNLLGDGLRDALDPRASRS